MFISKSVCRILSPKNLSKDLFNTILAAFNAPLALKEPVFCRFSALKNTFLPTIESRVELVKYGVKWMYGEILSCAFLMSESAIFIRLVILFSTLLSHLLSLIGYPSGSNWWQSFVLLKSDSCILNVWKENWISEYIHYSNSVRSFFFKSRIAT